MQQDDQSQQPSLQPFDISSVPVAARPALLAVDHYDTEEQTVWFNPFDYDVAVQVHIGSKVMEGKWDDPMRLARWRSLPAPVRREMQTGIRVYVIPARSMRAIPSEFDMGIQMTLCLEPGCEGSKGLYCKNREHTNRQIVGGMYPRLVNKGTRLHPLEKPPTLHYALDDERARAREALEASQKALAESMHQQGMALVAAQKFEEAKKAVADAEARLHAQGATAEAESHKTAIASAAGKAPTKK